MKNRITSKLLERGVKSSCRGFPIIVRCLEIALSLDYVLVTKDVYPVVAREQGVSPAALEARVRRTLTRSGIGMTNLEFVTDFVTRFNSDGNSPK